MDRCALFVDAGYVLADGAMAVHGTRRRESVSWDYEGLLRLLASQATERSGLPMLRCYWYEATVEGRRSADHDALADLAGVKLRLAKMRPGRREGVESAIHRDLETLARNKAISDAMVVSAEEDLAQVIADVQDLGLRVTLLNIAVDGDMTFSRALRQECDDVVEMSSEHLRPFVELIAGAEPARADEWDDAPLIGLRHMANGHGKPQELSAHPDLYAVGDTTSTAREPLAAPVDMALAATDFPGTLGAPAVPSAPGAPGAPADAGPAQPEPPLIRTDAVPIRPDTVPARQEPVPFRQDQPLRQDQPPLRPDVPPRPDPASRQELYAAPVAVPVAAEDQPAEFPAARSRQTADLSGYNPGAVREPLSRDAVIRDQQFSREPLPREPLPGELGDGMHPVPVVPGSAQIRRLPTRGAGMSAPVQPAPAPVQPAPAPAAPAPAPVQPGGGHPTAAQPVLSTPTATQPAPGQPIAPAPGYMPARNGSYSGPQPVAPGSAPPNPVNPPNLAGFAGAQPGADMYGAPGPVAPMAVVGPVGPNGSMGPNGVVGPNGPVFTPNQAAHQGTQTSASLADAVQSAHEEGQEFGASIARDAPALWLEAVLARKPRMPSDLEARLLQGSALPIDFLLHDEVRHALRRGFWDALERARR